jgi:hypothetical protein
VSEDILVAGREYETTTELERVRSDTSLSMSCGLGSRTSQGVVRAEQMKDVGTAQSRFAICFALLVNEQREADAGVLAKHLRVLPVAEANRGNRRSLFLKLFLMCAQLRYMLAAKDSAVVPEKDEHNRFLVPKRPEQHRSTIAIRQNDIGKRCAERMLHRLPQSSCGFAGTSHATSWRTPQLRYTNRR